MRRLAEILARASPVTTALVLGVIGVVQGGALRWIGIALLAVGLLIAARPGFWRGVLTGADPARVPDARFTEPGPFRVLAPPSGDNVGGVRAVRLTTGRPLTEAAAVVSKGGSVALGLSAASAAAVAAALIEAGVAAEVVGPAAADG